jgi:hypothetical protein
VMGQEKSHQIRLRPLVFQVKFKRKLRRHRKSISIALSGLVGSTGFVIWR